MLLAENLYFHRHQILQSKHARELETQQDFIFNISLAKVQYALNDIQHAIGLTAHLWQYINDHMKLFFDVILNPNSVKDPDRLRQLLTPYSISHIRLNENIDKFLLSTKKERLKQLMKDKATGSAAAQKQPPNNRSPKNLMPKDETTTIYDQPATLNDVVLEMI